MEPRVPAPITIALVNDYDIVVMGVAHILEQYGDRVVIAELDTNKPVSDIVDIALYDSFGQPESDHDEISVLVRNQRARRVGSTPGTSTPSSSRAPASKAFTGICQRHYRRATWYPPWKRSMPARS
jgi:hypothetical protein